MPGKLPSMTIEPCSLLTRVSILALQRATSMSSSSNVAGFKQSMLEELLEPANVRYPPSWTLTAVYSPKLYRNVAPVSQVRWCGSIIALEEWAFDTQNTLPFEILVFLQPSPILEASGYFCSDILIMRRTWGMRHREVESGNVIILPRQLFCCGQHALVIGMPSFIYMSYPDGLWELSS